ncbi:MAG TPA: methionyl-tRNA formyltransferase [Thermodesulfobacteriota bacterium]|nr:methionyl-tRNA formyltransferase [Deltaproteobacteria bacterium]HOC37865.1 methionyl-tRNA formyltransferase [Thermodesulfobacteriota bacterium]
MSESWRIVFMGTSDFACPSLKILAEGEDIVAGVFTQPDRPQGRGLRIQQTPVKTLAQQHEIPVFQPEKLNRSLDMVLQCNPDLIVVAAYGQILSQKVLDIPRHGCINIHASLLPKYRGAAPITWALVRGETASGVTTMLMNKDLDAGDILLQQEVAIDPDETAGALHDRLARVGAELLASTIRGWKRKAIIPRRQDESLVTYAPLLKKEDGLIDWTQPANVIHNLVRGMNPWPGAYTFLQEELLKVFAVQPAPTFETEKAGTIVSVNDHGIMVAAGKGAVIVTEVQLQGRKRLPIAEFLRGRPLKPGTRLGK